MVLDQCKYFELTMTLGDFYTKVGNEKVSSMTGDSGLGERNDQGDK